MMPYVPEDRTCPWLNTLPTHWVLKPLKYLVGINTSVLTENTPADYELRYIDISSVSSDGSIGQPEPLFFCDAPSRARRLVQRGDTIVSTVRTYLKAIAYINAAEPNLICSTGFAVIRPGPLVHPRFLFYWTRSTPFIDEVCARSVGVSYPAINAHEIGSLPFPLLPTPEQARIATFLDQKVAALREMLQTVQGLVSLSDSATGALVDYRDQLITLAVTGKLPIPELTREDAGCP